MTLPLAPDYYLHNFRHLISWINKSYADLLTGEEALFIKKFHQLDDASQCLLVRLISRKGPYFRADKLAYVEIPDISVAARRLIELDLLEVDPAIDICTCANLLTKPELISVFTTELAAKRSGRKELLIEILCAEHPVQNLWSVWTGGKYGELYHIELAPIIDTFLLLFFGNAHQNLSEFILQDLGLVRYENYEIDERHRIFSSREEIALYQLLLTLRDQLEQATELADLQKLVQQLPGVSSNHRLERRRGRLCNQIAYQLERLGELDLALQLYCQQQQPPARERRIRLLEKRGDFDQAWLLLSELLSSPLDEQERQAAERIAPRLAKKTCISFVKKPRFAAREVHLELPVRCDGLQVLASVEERVRDYYHTEITPCFYVENQLFNALLGLWLWPEMFRGVAGAFANPFQSAPLDLYHSNFLQHRPGISELWQLFDTAAHQQHLMEVWQNKFGMANPLVNWQFVDEKLLSLALTCIPAAHLGSIFERQLFDLAANRSGFPDLIQFFPKQKIYRLIEVKGPGDRIQDNQQRWLEFFAQQEIPAEVCYVSWCN